MENGLLRWREEDHLGKEKVENEDENEISNVGENVVTATVAVVEREDGMVVE